MALFLFSCTFVDAFICLSYDANVFFFKPVSKRPKLFPWVLQGFDDDYYFLLFF